MEITKLNNEQIVEAVKKISQNNYEYVREIKGNEAAEQYKIHEWDIGAARFTTEVGVCIKC